MRNLNLNREECFEDLFKFLERSELNEEQQILLYSFGGENSPTVTINNGVIGCSNNDHLGCDGFNKNCVGCAGPGK